MSLPPDPLRRSLSRPSPSRNPIQTVLAMPPRWLHMYSDFITKNAHQVSQIESALRSLTYIIPGRFRDAEIASETLHSGVQLLSLYHDAVLRGALLGRRVPGALLAGTTARIPSPHARYTKFWTAKSRLYRRIALLLQIVQYTELLWEMAAKRRGEKTRWRVVIVLEAVKAVCRLLLMRITSARPLVTPALPEREPLPPDESQDDGAALKELMGVEEDQEEDEEAPGAVGMNGHARAPHEREWTMPRTRSSLPSLPSPSDVGAYLQSRVLTADDIKPAARLLNTLSGAGRAAEVLHVLAPLIYAAALARSSSRNGRDGRKDWAPWLLGFGAEYAARQLREARAGAGGLRSTALENEEWGRRYWAAGWWAMRGAFYEHLTKGLVAGARRRMPSLLAGILEDYEYLWENYYFSTSA
ncbi:peroxisome membrane protein [Xylariaceae sp. FL0804]|nr:peroxisome membrane protein [Xylariaceae sp. FL0804]